MEEFTVEEAMELAERYANDEKNKGMKSVSRTLRLEVLRLRELVAFAEDMYPVLMDAFKASRQRRVL